jgi:TRAP-type C4-dicarboxylate transport system permease small subunit
VNFRARNIVLLLPRIVLTALLVIAIADMLVGVFLRYVMLHITDWLDVDPVNFFWVEEVGELSLAWLTMIGAGIGIADRAHFTLRILTHRLPLRWQHRMHVINHLIIASFGVVVAGCGAQLAMVNSSLASPALQINLAWLYASAAVGGVLISLCALAALFAPAPDEGSQGPVAMAETRAAGDD